MTEFTGTGIASTRARTSVLECSRRYTTENRDLLSLLEGNSRVLAVSLPVTINGVVNLFIVSGLILFPAGFAG